MTPEQKREREAKVAALAKEVFIHHRPTLGPDPGYAFRMAEWFIEHAERRWEEAK